MPVFPDTPSPGASATPAGMPLSDLVAEVYERSGVDQNDPMVTPQAVTRAVNTALRHYQIEADWPWLQATGNIPTVSGQDNYGVPTDWRKTRALKDQNGRDLDRFDVRQLDDRWTGNESGQPSEFAIDGDQIYLRPKPNGVVNLTHRYVRRENLLTQSSDRPYLPLEFSQAVIEYASSLVLRKVRRYGDANISVQIYEGEISKMRDDRRRTVGPFRPRHRVGSAF